jgi:hypothetical protein
VAEVVGNWQRGERKNLCFCVRRKNQFRGFLSANRGVPKRNPVLAGRAVQFPGGGSTEARAMFAAAICYTKSDMNRTRALKIIVSIVLFSATFWIPLYGVTINASTVLTVITFLFSILIGFFIAAATANYLNFQACLAEENSGLILLFNLGNIVQPKAREKIGGLIDAYVIRTLDYHLGEYAENTEKEFNEIIKAVDKLEPAAGNRVGMAVLQVLHEAKANLLKTRQSVLLRAAPKVVRKSHWVILIALAASLEIFLFALRDGEILSDFIIGVICTVLFLILMLLYELDSNLFLEDQLAFSDPQKVFRGIGTLPYYPAYALEAETVQPPKGDYRVGIYKDYPRSFEKEIKTIRGTINRL